jgi:hypothetical protein
MGSTQACLGTFLSLHYFNQGMRMVPEEFVVCVVMMFAKSMFYLFVILFSRI